MLGSPQSENETSGAPSVPTAEDSSMKTIRMATVKDDQDYTLCSCGAVKLNRFQCFNGCGVVTYPADFSIGHEHIAQYARNLEAVIQRERERARIIDQRIVNAYLEASR
jgi:hypothetical protein